MNRKWSIDDLTGKPGFFSLSQLELPVQVSTSWFTNIVNPLRWSLLFILFYLFLYVPSTIFQLYRDGFSWVEPVLSSNKDTTQWCRWGSNLWPFGLESSNLPLYHCAPVKPVILHSYWGAGDKNISILRLSCRMSGLQFSLVLQTHALVL